jgi:hypothetical protein
VKLGFSLENKISLGGKQYCLDVSFHNVMKATALLKDSDISERVRVSTVLRLLLTPVSHIRTRFFSFSQKTVLLKTLFDTLVTNSNTNKSSDSILSLENDGVLIYSAFMQVYGIDLYKDRLDWRSFCALLSCIPENTALFSVMRARQCETSESMNEGLETLFNKLTGGNKND